MEKIKLGKYQHYKGGFYEILGVGKNTETMEDFVVYKSLYKTSKFPIGSIWIRPKEMFFEQVEMNGQKIPRFKFLGEI